MRNKLNEKLIQSQIGYKTLAMLDHYRNIAFAGDREKIRAAQVEIFGGLLLEAEVRVVGKKE
jgi:hypothetical protein